MLKEALFWIYIVNFTLFIVHEMEGAYWKEWGMFTGNLTEKKGLTLYLLTHILIIAVLFFGLFYIRTIAGFIIAFVLSVFLAFHFIVHVQAMKQERGGFNYPISSILLFFIFFLSVAQFVIASYLLVSRI